MKKAPGLGNAMAHNPINGKDRQKKEREKGNE
jgi:hypothetical protein